LQCQNINVVISDKVVYECSLHSMKCALKQPSVIESLNGDKPDAADGLWMTVADDGPGFDSTLAISSMNATTTVEDNIKLRCKVNNEADVIYV